MRILHVINSLEFGGAEKVVVTLANEFARHHHVNICCISGIGELARELDPRISVFAMGRGVGNDYLLPFRLARHLRRGSYDVVHTHNWSVFLEAGIASWMARSRTAIHTVHGPYLSSGNGLMHRIKRLLRHSLERVVALHFDRVVAVSAPIARYTIDDVGIGSKRVVVVHNGISGLARIGARSPGNTLTFIAVGRLDAIKNHQMMLEAFQAAATQHRHARLVLVGDGPERERIEETIQKLGLTERVELLGFRTDVSELLSQADIFLVSSRYEGISIALLEAMRAGLPVLATRVGGIPETIQDGRTGLLVDSEDIQAYANGMSQLADSESLRRRLGEAARAVQQEKFSLAGVLKQYAVLYVETEQTEVIKQCR